MKSLTRFLAVFGLLFAIALSCPANATNTEETKTIVKSDLSDSTLEVADFSNNDFGVLKFELKNLGVFSNTLSVEVSKFISKETLLGSSQSYTKIKRFPNARDGLNY